jgi:hypothetical protein
LRNAAKADMTKLEKAQLIVQAERGEMSPPPVSDPRVRYLMRLRSCKFGALFEVASKQMSAMLWNTMTLNMRG